MIKHNQDGAANGLVISLVLTVILLVGAIVLAAWAYSGRQDYKDHTDAKINAAVKVAVAANSSAKDKQFAEDEKNPLKTYNGPEAYGSIVLQYPKTWSGYVSDSTSNNSNGNTPVDGFFYPGVVPSTGNMASVFALRIQVLNQSYSQTLSGLTSHAANPPIINPYALPKVPKTVGVKITGTLPISGSNDKTGIMVVLPLRSETLEIWTEGNQFTNDFNNYILPNFTFSP